MMQRKGKASGLLMMVLAVFSGCSQNDYQVGQTAQRRWRPIDNEKMLRARQAPAPRIAPETHFAAGVLLEQQGQPGQAVDQFRRAIALNHKYAEAYHRLGVLLGMTGQHVEAEANLRKAVALKPQQAFFHNDLGFQLMQTKQWAEAETEFRAALDLYPRMPRANINLALAVSQQGRYDEALACFRTALPEADAQFNLGLIYKTQQRYSEAADCFRRALEERPTFVAAGTQLASCSQNVNGGQQTESFTHSTTTPSFESQQPQQVTAQSNDATIPITTSNESRPHTMAAQTMPEEPAPTYVAPTPASSSQDIEWIEVQTSDGPVSEDPITEPLLIEPEPAPLQPQPDPVQPQPTPSEPQASMQPTSTFEPKRIEWSKPEPMPITAYGYEPAPTPARSQPTPRPQPVSNSSAQEVYVVRMSDVGGAPSAATQPTHSPAPTTQPTTQVTPVVQPTSQSSAMPAGYQDETPPPGLTPEEIRVWRAERRGQALWLEEQRTGKRVARTPTYFHEAKYTTQIINEQAGSSSDSRSTMAATVYETRVITPSPGSVQQGEQPLAWLETIAPDNSELQMAVNNLRCDNAPGSVEQDFSPLYEQLGYLPVPMTIVPPESPAAPVEFAPAPRPAFSRESSQTNVSTMQSNSSGEAVVPMTDPHDRSSR